MINLFCQGNSKINKEKDIFKFDPYSLQLACGSEQYSTCEKLMCKECNLYCLRNWPHYCSPTNKERRRINSWILHKFPDAFRFMMDYELTKIAKLAIKRNRKPVIRLHALGEYAFEKDPIFFDMFNKFPQIQFYDYTKDYTRNPKLLGISNYDLCFSNPIIHGLDTDYKWSIKAMDLEVQSFKWLNSGGISSFIFLGKIPNKYHGYNVINGDQNDYIFTKPRGTILGLKFKGSLKRLTERK